MRNFFLWARRLFMVWIHPELVPAPAPAPAHVTVDIHQTLERLPNTLRALRRLRHSDPTAHRLLSKLGAPVFDLESTELSDAGVSYEFLSTRPMFRAGFFGLEDEFLKSYVPLAGAYLVRVDRPRTVAPRPGCQTYRLGMLYVSGARDQNLGAYVAVSSSGVVTPLPERCTTFQPLPGMYGGAVAHTALRVPPWVSEMARDNGRDACGMLAYLVSLVASAKVPDDHILVRAGNGREVAAFAIARNDGKRFFRQRDSDRATDGKRKRILHYVEGHARRTAHGVQNVRPHYRGDRHFQWHGYNVRVSGLGFHHQNLFDTPVGLHEENPEHAPLVEPEMLATLGQERYNA
jgi:hypothetical protein